MVNKTLLRIRLATLRWLHSIAVDEQDLQALETEIFHVRRKLRGNIGITEGKRYRVHFLEQPTESSEIQLLDRSGIFYEIRIGKRQFHRLKEHMDFVECVEQF